MNWSVIKYVTSGLTLAALVVVLALQAFKLVLDRRRQLIEAAPPEQATHARPRILRDGAARAENAPVHRPKRSLARAAHCHLVDSFVERWPHTGVNAVAPVSAHREWRCHSNG